MKLRAVISLMLVIAALAFSGCSNDDGEHPVYRSEHFTFTDDMATYMTSYTRLMLKDEMLAAGVDSKKSLSEQRRTDGETWEDYLYSQTVESINKILLYCEAAKAEGYVISEGMSYKASELISYLTSTAEEAGYTADEYIREIYGDTVTMEALEVCTQMMALCESYEIDLAANVKISDEEAAEYADANPDKFLKFNALRYTTPDKELAESLEAAADKEDFLKIMSGISGYALTDSDKNGIADILEVKDATVADDPSGEFASSEDTAVGDTVLTENDGKYTVTMITSLPARRYELLWDYRMLYLSSESSSDPLGDVTSLLSQWEGKQRGEQGFSELCARYSDDPSAYYGGLYDDTGLSEIPAAISSWICDDARVRGDTTVISNGDNGAYMLYYADGNKPRWACEAVAEAKSDKVKEKIDSLKEEIEKHFVFDEKPMKDVVAAVAEAKEE